MKSSEILDKAADILVRDGWYQGSYYKEPEGCEIEDDRQANRSAPCCQSGAIRRAVFGVAWKPYEFRQREEHEAQSRAENYMMRYVSRLYDGAYSAIEWNDQPDRTVEEVIGALRGAANDAREAGE